MTLFVQLQTAVGATDFALRNKVVVLWSPSVLRRVADMYTQLPDLGFVAFQRSPLIPLAKQLIESQVEPTGRAICLFLDVEDNGAEKQQMSVAIMPKDLSCQENIQDMLESNLLLNTRGIAVATAKSAASAVAAGDTAAATADTTAAEDENLCRMIVFALITMFVVYAAILLKQLLG